MAAIVTKNQRIQNAKNFIEDFSGSPERNFLYLWLGKSDPWNNNIESFVDGTIDLPIDGEYQKSQIYNEMIAMKRVFEENMVHVVPTTVWTRGDEYQAWDDEYQVTEISEGGCPVVKNIYDTKFYVVTIDFNVYKCLVAGPEGSTEMPTHTSVTSIEPKMYSDGYVWHYMYTITTNDALIFYNNSFMPVHEKDTQHQDQADIDGGIFRVIVEEGGSGYTGTTTVTIDGPGTGAIAEPVIVGGEITEINITTTVDDYLNHGSGYTSARVIISDPGRGSGAVARAVYSPRGGHGYNPLEELGGYNIEVAVDVEGSEEGKFITTNDYRRLGLIRNPMTSDDPPVLATDVVMNGLRSLSLTNISGIFSPDEVVEEVAAGGDGNDRAKGFIDQFTAGETEGTGTLYYHQNSKSGWDPFTAGIGISSNESNSATISAVNPPDYTPFTGEIVFMENRAPIRRTESTREEIRLIVQF